MSSNDKQLRPLIVNFGNCKFRFGWAGEDLPKIIEPSIYVDITEFLFTSDVIDGLEDIFIKDNAEKHLFGTEALKYQDILKVREFKKENNYIILYKYFYYYYQKLNISPENLFKQPIIIITPFFTSELEKTKLKQIFFNYFKFPKLLFLSETQAILASLQEKSGIIVNMGESHTYISTVFRGFTNILARDLFPIAGKDITNHFLNMILSRRSSGKSYNVDKFLAKEIKEKTALCVLDLAGEKKRIKEGLTKYDQIVNLPDGSSLKINLERIMISEPLFDPKLIHIDHIGLGEAIAIVIKTWERENWEELLPNIILAGGTSMIPGLKERLTLDLKNYFPDRLKQKIKIISVKGRENMGWIGGSILCLKNQLQKGWISNTEQDLSNT